MIADREGPVEASEIADPTDLSERKLSSALHRFEQVGALELLPAGEVQIPEQADLSQAALAAAARQDRCREIKRERLSQMEQYANISSCRREQLLRYFGDVFTGPCNNCENCPAPTGTIEVDPSLGTRREVA